MDNIILIGMPAAGKSTFGVLLAKAMLYDFVDCDLIIQNKYGASLAALIEERGEEAFVKLENDTLSSLDYSHTVIATGGSAIYGEEAMAHLATLGKIVYLKVDLDEIKRRIGNIQTRGVIMHGNPTLDEMFHERCFLYEKYAHIVVDLTGMTAEQAITAMKEAVLGEKTCS